MIFLRGVNVGRHGKFAMADFKRMLEELGATDVKTHLNSGNAVFTSSAKPDDIARRLEAAIEAEFGKTISCVARSAAQVRRVIENDPFHGVADDGSRYVVMFLSGAPDRAAIADLRRRAAEFAPEQFVHRGHEIYLWCPNGLRDAKLPLALDNKRMRVVATARNWNTVRKMLDLAEQ
jgi:uncharacterized protein (DUF1697 family)